MANWIVGVFMTFIAILGLFMASYAVDTAFSWVGILFFITSVVYIYKQVSRNIK